MELQRDVLDEQLRCEQSSNQGSVDTLLNDRPLPGHQFGVRLIALCIELAKRIGFRATEFVIEQLFQWIGVDLKVPSHDAIEQWTLRLGVAELNDAFSKDQNVLWMADHSSQIGKEKVLLIIGIALEDLPPPGQSLDLEKLKVLAVVPGERWKKEDVGREYRKLASRIGAPVYLLCDGAVELRDPAENLEKDGRKTIVLGDLKHHAANLLEKQIGRSERFKAFMTEVGLTRNRVQQTELCHLAPPPLRQKSRFMNLANLLNWAQMVLHHLADPGSPSRKGITTERMEDKLGWLREFAVELSLWSECQDVIDQSLSVINQGHLSIASIDELESRLWIWLGHDEQKQPANEMAEALFRFVKDSVAKLRSDAPRAWLSTEILESLFGRFKHLERQHSRGGFTRLLAAIPTLCRKATADLIRLRFAKTKADDVQCWLAATLGTTLTANRNAAYRRYNAQAKPSLPK
ncbi:MAG: hypothetical protein MI861_04895 [Pirellulales bacterium]|nr:hypothetical protein [Pirellulales bacterium]